MIDHAALHNSPFVRRGQKCCVTCNVTTGWFLSMRYLNESTITTTRLSGFGLPSGKRERGARASGLTWRGVRDVDRTAFRAELLPCLSNTRKSSEYRQRSGPWILDRRFVLPPMYTQVQALTLLRISLVAGESLRPVDCWRKILEPLIDARAGVLSEIAFQEKASRSLVAHAHSLGPTATGYMPSSFCR